MARMILHPTDFSPASEIAFAHALRFALDGRGLLSVLHVEDGPAADAHWSEYPQVRGTLERWGLLPEGSPRSALEARLGLAVEKVVGHGAVAEAVADFAERRAMDLVVLATGGREGPSRWLAPSVAEPAARRTLVPALFVHGDGRQLVSPQDGSVSLRNVVVAVAPDPSPHRGVATALYLLRELGASEETVDLHVLHVGDGEAPELRIPEAGRWRVETLQRPGDPAAVVPEVASALEADLVVVVTAGHHGFVDALRGSTSEMIVRRAPCPVLSVPEES